MGVIRSAEKEDLEQVYKLIIELENQKLDFQSFEKIYIENMNNPRVLYLTYIDNHNIVGFVSIHIQSLLHHCARIAEIQELVVLEGVRGKGFGMQLFNKAIEIAKENDCAQIEVCCNQKRKLSHVFYKKMGMLNNHFKFTMPLK